jgi:hypothetical protein
MATYVTGEPQPLALEKFHRIIETSVDHRAATADLVRALASVQPDREAVGIRIPSSRRPPS